MSDLYLLNPGSGADVDRALAEFERRGELILEHVFHRSYDVRQAFRQWFADFAREHDSSDLILHDDPLLVAAEYIGLDVSSIAGTAVEREYQQLAHKHHW